MQQTMEWKKRYLLSRFTLVRLMPLKCPTKNTPIPCIQTQLSVSHLFSVDLIISFHMKLFLQGLFTLVRLELCNAFINSHLLHHSHELVQVSSAALKLIFLSYQGTGRPQKDKKAKVGFSELNITTAVVKRRILSCAVKAKGAYYRRPLLSSQQQWHPV